ncbi:hypothetical protein A5320_17375 [Rheinheimera sp. SA_1]|uniref:hypothetical protein n=1 Tax=Rheinheimera sp. SA_1 TaxID=1827365 RepID=UPI0007FF1FCD|nr:hypothetical protein [Rheinheimera sp. SA_1]OBP13691.1 hypothetical protein A5320_17375 [Rheinheimera sp. SA_1]
MNEKIVLNTNIYFNSFRLILFLVLLLFAAKLRFELGGGWMVDTILMFFCILVVFLYVIPYAAKFKVGNQELAITVYRNCLGSKLIKVKVSGRNNECIFTTAKEKTLTGLAQGGDIVLEGLDADNITVRFVEA